MTKVTIIKDEVEEFIRPRIGDYFVLDEDFPQEVYILTRVKDSTVSLIGLQVANRFHDPVLVTDAYSISEEEWKEITTGASFTKLKEVQISIKV